jgi:hypothetical protein
VKPVRRKEHSEVHSGLSPFTRGRRGREQARERKSWATGSKAAEGSTSKGRTPGGDGPGGFGSGRPISDGGKPPKPRRGAESRVKRQGRAGPGNRRRLVGRIKPLKVKAQERCRGETNPAGRIGSVAPAEPSLPRRSSERSGHTRKPAARAGLRAALRFGGVPRGSSPKLASGSAASARAGSAGSAFGRFPHPRASASVDVACRTLRANGSGPRLRACSRDLQAR